MLALPSAAAPAPRRQLFVGTALACVAAGALIGSMLALWMRLRLDALHVTDGLWIPKGINVPMVPANTMLLAFLPIAIFAQWAVWAAGRGGDGRQVSRSEERSRSDGVGGEQGQRRRIEQPPASRTQ